MSSITTTSGRRRAAASRKRRTANWISSIGAGPEAKPTARATRGDPSALLVVVEEGSDRLLIGAPGELLDHLGQRPERNALAVRQATADHDRRRLPGVGEEAPDQARLADPRGTHDGHRAATALARGVVEGHAQRAQLELAPDHADRRSVERRLGRRRQREQPLGRDRRRLALEAHRLQRLEPRDAAE
jgi:hypothetical protein